MIEDHGSDVIGGFLASILAQRIASFVVWQSMGCVRLVPCHHVIKVAPDESNDVSMVWQVIYYK